MSIKQRGLGRDLEALLGKRRVSETAPATSTTDVTLPAANIVTETIVAIATPNVAKNNELRQIAIEQLQPGRYQPRREFPERREKWLPPPPTPTKVFASTPRLVGDLSPRIQDWREEA